MPIESSQLAARLSETIDSLYRERDHHSTAIADIDGKIAGALRALGLDPSDVGVSAGQSNRLPRSDPRSYPLNPNTMGSAMLDALIKADHGYSRVEMRKLLEEDPRFTKQIKSNVNSYYNTIARYTKNKRVIDIDGLLYHPDRAPLPEGLSDPTGQHLPSNVSSLFADRRTGSSDD